jgi:hypothetical protein
MRARGRAPVCLGATLAVVVALLATARWAAPPAGAGQTAPPTNGFMLLAGDGGIFTFGVPMVGAPASDPTRCPDNVTDRTEPNGTCWSVALTPSGLGYWVLNGDTGTIYPYGPAVFYGQPAARFADQSREFVPNFLQIVATRDAKGYWVYEAGASDLGTVDHFGDAAFFGDTRTLAGQSGKGFNGSPVGMAATPDSKGYWEVRSDGGVFAFGDAKFYGSAGAIHLARPIIGIAATADGKGYWLLASDGGVFAFGDAVFAGSTGGLELNAPVVGMARNTAGSGYWLAAADGGVFAFGGAPFIGSVLGLSQSGVHLHRPIFAIATKPPAAG